MTTAWRKANRARKRKTIGHQPRLFRRKWQRYRATRRILAERALDPFPAPTADDYGRIVWWAVI